MDRPYLVIVGIRYAKFSSNKSPLVLDEQMPQAVTTTKYRNPYLKPKSKPVYYLAKSKQH